MALVPRKQNSISADDLQGVSTFLMDASVGDTNKAEINKLRIKLLTLHYLRVVVAFPTWSK